MTKAELVASVSANAGITKAAATNAINAFIESITKSLKKGQKVTLVGLGTFSVIKRKARKGRNPRTGEAIKIPATKTPKFSAGKAFKESVK